MAAGEYLLPIFDEKGKVVAYERAMDPARLEMLPRDEHLGRMLGVCAGRIAEETASDEANSQLVATLKEIWEKGQKAARPGSSSISPIPSWRTRSSAMPGIRSVGQRKA